MKDERASAVALQIGYIYLKNENNFNVFSIINKRRSDGEDARSYAREGKYRPLIRLLEKAVKTWKDNNKK
jgi:hypothetical protein